MIEMRFVELSVESQEDYVRVGGRRCQLQFRIKMGDAAGWWTPVRIEEQKPDDRMQPFHQIPGMTDAQRLDAHDFHNTMEKR